MSLLLVLGYPLSVEYRVLACPALIFYRHPRTSLKVKFQSGLHDCDLLDELTDEFLLKLQLVHILVFDEFLNGIQIPFVDLLTGFFLQKPVFSSSS